LAVDGPVSTLAGWIRIDSDGDTTLLINATEMGQGATSGLAQILADELELDWSHVRIDYAPVEPAYYGMWETYQTGGSGSVRGMFDRLRVAGATARTLLVMAAAQQWRVPQEECNAQHGSIHHAGSGRSATYGELAATASRLSSAVNVKPKPREQWRLIGKPLRRLDVSSKVDGSAVFGIDVKLPNLLTATIAQCPTFGGSLQSVDIAPAMSIAGVRQVVQLEKAIAVVARDYWTARNALAALHPVWKPGTNPPGDSAEIFTRLRALSKDDGKAYVGEGQNEVEVRQRCAAGLAAATRVIEQSYEAPLLSHSPMEPMNGTALVRHGRAELWLPTQIQSEIKTAVAKTLGFSENAVTIHTTQLGGGFGRRLQTDYGVQAALIARQVDAPLKLLWSREEDTQHGFYRPAAVARLRAGIDGGGAITAFRAYIACMDADAPIGGLANQPYALPNQLVTYAGWNPGVPLGAWRSVDASQNLFFFESFIDELAHATGVEPLAMRRRLLATDARALRVLDAAAKLGNWQEPLPKQHGRGIAFLRGFGSLTAQVAEVSVVGNTLRVHRVSCAVDCGTAVNPSSIRAQFEGGVIFGLTAAALGEITIGNGRVQQSNFDNYPLLRMPQCPRIDVTVIENPDEKIGGIGEPPVPPIAPAVANAIFAATGRRIRQLPFSKAGLELRAASSG
jgi:isoquinoline 1-oxidoreductase beta subunit